jgi:hypothetical protein
MELLIAYGAGVATPIVLAAIWAWLMSTFC